MAATQNTATATPAIDLKRFSALNMKDSLCALFEYGHAFNVSYSEQTLCCHLQNEDLAVKDQLQMSIDDSKMTAHNGLAALGSLLATHATNAADSCVSNEDLHSLGCLIRSLSMVNHQLDNYQQVLAEDTEHRLKLAEMSLGGCHG